MSQSYNFPPVSVTADPLAATAANQTIEIAKLTSIDNKTPTLGQQTMANSLPVAIASDQSAIPVTGPLTDTQLRATAVPVSGTVIVTQATGTNLHAVIDSGTVAISGTPNVAVTSSVLPTGASTETTLSALNTKVPANLTVTATRLLVDASGTTQPVSGSVTVTQATGTNLHTVVDSSALPTGAATASNQTSGAQTTQVVNGANTLAIGTSGNILVSGASAVGVAPTLNPISIAGVDGGGLKRHFLTDTAGRLEIDTIQTLPLPTGAATSANQTAAQTSLSSIDAKTPALGQATMAASQPVTFASNQSALATTIGGKATVNLARNDYSTTSVTTAAYVQLIASTSAIANLLEIFDSSGQTLVLAIGAAAAEVDKFYINPGGNGQVPLNIPAGSRVSIKAVTATASAGYINLTLYS